MNYSSRTQRINLFVAEQERLRQTMTLAADVARIAPEGSRAREIADAAAKALGALAELGPEIDLTPATLPLEKKSKGA
jgi:hypothetical protein